MLKTGNRAFTFLEVMIAAAILALGTVLIYEAFFISLDSYNYCTDYLNVASWAEAMLWQAQAKLREGQSLNAEESGDFTENNKIFSWNLNYNLADAETRLYSIDLLLSWKTGKREFTLSRNTYAILEQE